MAISRKTWEKIFFAAFIWLATLGYVHIANRAHFFERPELMTLDVRQRFYRSETPIDESIAVVLIDEASLRAMNPIVGRWPWPRSIHADIVDFISLGQPKAIVFDVLFTEDDRSGPDADLRLAEASAASGNVIHAMQLLRDVPDELNKNLLNQPLPRLFRDRFRLESEITKVARQNYHSVGINRPNNYSIPVPQIAMAAFSVGAVDFDPDVDGVFRRTSLARGYGEDAYPVLSLAPFASKGVKVGVKRNEFTIGELSAPLDDTGRYLVNFCGKYGAYSMSGVIASAQKVMRGDVEGLMIDPSEFKDKIVFIGSSAVGIEDLKATPIDARMPGVYIHASILSNLLNNDYLIVEKESFTYWAAAILAALGVLIVLFTGSMYIQVGVPLVLWLGYTGMAFEAYTGNHLWPLTAPTAALWVSVLGAFIYFGVTEGRARLKVRRMFSLYVSPEVLSQVVEQADAEGDIALGREEYISILFSDIRSFTNISEKLTAQRVVEMLNIYFTEMVEAIFKHQGTVDKFIGDAIMCFWGAPVRMDDHEAAAVKSALEMIEGLKKVNVELEARGFEPLAIGIGIHTGNAVLGNIGSAKKINYTVIGDSVNLASRLEGVTKTYGAPIIISEVTYHGLKGAIPCGVVDVVAVKGKNEPIKLYRPLVGARPTAEEVKEARELAEKIDRAFDHYLNRRWDEALAAYGALPHHKSFDVISQRCADYRHDEPPEDWNGVLVLKTK